MMEQELIQLVETVLKSKSESNYTELKSRWNLSSDTHQKAISSNDSENLLERNVSELLSAQIKEFYLDGS